MATTHPAPKIDLWRRFDPFPTQRRFFTSRAKYRLYSGGVGSGKTKCGCRESIRHAVTYPGSRNLVARLTGTRLNDSTLVTFWREMREIGFTEGRHYTWGKQDRTVRWWNGSEIIFRHLEDEEGMGSLEFSTVFVDEGSEVPDSIYKVLFPARLRWHLPGCDYHDRLLANGGNEEGVANCECPRRAWICTNPGASGYLKAVTLQQMGKEWEWFPARPAENPYNGPGYYEEMQRQRAVYGDAWFKRYHDGDWSAFEGQRFTMFDRATHVLPTDFHPTADYEIVEGWDFGHRETFVVWLAYRPDSNEPVVAFDELQVREVEQPEQVAKAVRAIRHRHQITQRVRALGDPAGAAASQFSEIGPITAYAQLGIHIAPCRAGKSPIARADLLAKFMVERRVQIGGEVWPGLVFSPRCRHLVDSIVNLRWKPGNSRLGEEPREQFVKINDHGCVAEGSAVATPLGPRAIETLRPGDEVWTREGPRPVQIVARTNEHADCLTVTTVGGRALHLTADHPVWVVGHGWIRTDALTYGDIIHAWNNTPNTSTTAATGTVATPMRNNGATASTTDAEAGAATSTAPYGKTPTASPPPTATRYTTATATPSTTTPATSSPYPHPNTATRIPSPKSDTSASSPTSTASDTSRPNGTAPTKAANGTAGTAKPHGTPATSANTPAPTAENSSSHATTATAPDTAPTDASRPPGAQAESTTKNAPAPPAGTPTPSTATPATGHALDCVANVYAGPRATPVWNLLVAETHEYYANGILVSNCDALGYGIIGVPPPGAPPTEPRVRPGVHVHPTPADAYRADDDETWVTA